MNATHLIRPQYHLYGGRVCRLWTYELGLTSDFKYRYVYRLSIAGTYEIFEVRDTASEFFGLLAPHYEPTALERFFYEQL